MDAQPESSVRLQAEHPADERAERGLQPWQFFVLAALGCATAATFMARGQGVTAVVLIALMMAGAAIVGISALRTIQPLVSPQDDRTVMIGQRTRAALEREKLLALRAIKELEFDHAMGKVSEEDWKEMSSRLRARATRLIRQLDAGAGYRQRIEQDLAKKMHDRAKDTKGISDHGKDTKAVVCSACSTRNDHDARFCKACGGALDVR